MDIDDALVEEFLKAVDDSKEEDVKRLINKERAAACRPNGQTALWLAAREGNESIMKLLLSNEPPLDTVNEYGETALYKACDSGNAQVSRLLIEADKAGKTIKMSTKKMHSPLHAAASSGLVDICKLLLQRGAEIESKDEGITASGATPLAYAASGGHTKVVSCLLEHGANINAQDSFDSTPLHRAAYKGHSEAAQVLIEKGADKTIKDKYGRTPYEEAMKQGKYETAQVIGN